MPISSLRRRGRHARPGVPRFDDGQEVRDDDTAAIIGSTGCRNADHLAMRDHLRLIVSA